MKSSSKLNAWMRGGALTLVFAVAAYGQSTGSGNGTQDNTNPDVTTLNTLLALQNLQAAYYTQGLAKFTASDFSNTALSCTTGANTPFAQLQAISTQTGQQVTALQKAITKLGGTPVQPCTYNFTFTTPQDFTTKALTLGNATSAAYASLAGSVSGADVRSSLAGAAAVEARQAAYLSLLNSSNPFPNPFEPSISANDINAAVKLFTTSCPGGTNGGGGGNGVTAVAGPKTLTVTVSKQVTLDATASTAPDNGTLTYSWTLAPGSLGAAIVNPNSANPIVQFSQGYGVYTFQLTVTDKNGTTATDTLSILYVGR